MSTSLSTCLLVGGCFALVSWSLRHSSWEPAIQFAFGAAGGLVTWLGLAVWRALR